ncbi:MAG: thermonuclease family protein [candidate division KSB1 bacterium]
MKHSLYHYRAHVVEVYDGDTCTVDIDLGLYTWLKTQKVRLYRINAPEMRGAEKEAGTKARDFLRSLILGQVVIMETIKDNTEKYGRYLGELWLEREGQWVNVNDAMVQNGFAVYKNYGE